MNLPSEVPVSATQATEAGNLVNGLPNFAKPQTALAPINSAFYSILTGTGKPNHLSCMLG